MSENELQALITLIDDPDEGVYSQVRDKIVSYGDHVVPQLERAWEYADLGDLFRDRIEDILHSIHLKVVADRLVAWKETGGEDLLEGALIISRYRYPDMDEQKVKARLASIRQDIWLELNDHLTAFEKVRVFNHIFFQIHGFKGNKRNYHAPQNSYINEVLDSKKGNPLSLAIIYQVLAEDLNLPMRGVNLPNHFVLAYLDEDSIGGADSGQQGEENILFYVNAFSQGDILGRNEINEFLEKLKIEPRASFYAPCSNMDMIRRQLNNLANSYHKQGDSERSQELGTLRDLLGPVVD
ncbi:MAG: transglutaminase family protein [Flavobacteriales bacterium]|nr:transglutaminase family protein [Flavobacteriales bacterium]MBP6641980.1 transglutaminase family protein [Flavobacteriales bacterium]MBP7154706.1 transglutaminase family protein [Flavobacteriales bacterium]HQV73851.1 transglutaminase-like domain-containing protein [Flavobacteriales bacterium]HQW40169.1 transglutaminase-like domain-containing protein [Flavobacteriales bacterium]